MQYVNVFILTGKYHFPCGEENGGDKIGEIKKNIIKKQECDATL